MKFSFVHLHLHTEYSLSDGLLRIPSLIEAAVAAGFPALAVTDQANLFCLVRFYRAALSAGLKPIAGAELWVQNPAAPNRPDRLVLLVQNQRGYGNLCRLITRSYLEGQENGLPQVQRNWIAEQAEGLIALSGGPSGEIGRLLLADREAEAAQQLDRWLSIFPDRFYLELIRTGREGEETCIQGSLALASAKGVPVVATNDVRFLRQEDFEAHEVRVCIHQGAILEDPRRPRPYSPQQYLRTPEEMEQLFAELPAALENSLEIAKRCNLELRLGKPCLPAFPAPEGKDAETFLIEEAQKGLAARCDPVPDAYAERLQRELSVINSMGFAGYFLIVADFIRWAKAQGIPVGPGRGSGAGSLVAYALQITDLDPIRYDLLFERFLNPERVSLPDFDVDFCMERRDAVIEYVAERYGRRSVSQIITFGTMAARAVVRDVGRVLGYPYGFVDRIAKMVPPDLDMTLTRALTESEELARAYAEEEEVRAILDRAKQLEGIARNAGKHAGGVLIAPGDLQDFMPLYCEPGGKNLVSQYDKDDAEQIGLVKFDFLGLRTLTIIDWACKTINEARQKQGLAPLDIAQIDLQDPKAFELLQRGETTAVFQLESQGMKDLIRRLRPDSFEEMIALMALFRPGPLQAGMVDDYIARKHGEAPVRYPHPDLEPVLKPTYGIILYQEQVMQIAQVLAGYSLGGADLLRRAMGKKKPAEMAKQRDRFLEGALARGVRKETAQAIFDLMEKFAGYGFNRSHSAAYALVSYQTLWLKAHYPAAFMAATLSADMDHTDKVVGLVEECQSLGLQVKPPDINRSEKHFTLLDDRTILYGLGAIKGIGAAALESLVQAKKDQGPFRDLWDLCRRIDAQKVNQRVFDALIRSGALDALGENRASLSNQLPLALRAAEQHRRQRALGQADLFSPGEAQSLAWDPQHTQQTWEEWEAFERLQGEKATLGLYFSGHPMDPFREECQILAGGSIGTLLKAGVEREACACLGLVARLRHKRGKQGKMASLVLEDWSGKLETLIFSELYESVRDLLELNQILLVRGSLRAGRYQNEWSLRATEVQTLAQAREQRADHLLLHFDGRDSETSVRERVQQLAESLRPYRAGRLPIQMIYRASGASGRLRFGKDWCIRPEESLLKALRKHLGQDAVQVVYAPFQTV